MTTYTLGQLTDDALRQYRATTRDLVVMLGQDLDAPAALTQETITLIGDMGGVTLGSLLAVLDETMYVMNVFASTNQAQVIRGYDDTTPVVASSGAIVMVNPPWPRAFIQDRIKDEIRSWGPQLFAVASVQVPIVNLQRGYDLGDSVGTVIRVLRVTAPQPPYIGAPGFWYTESPVDVEQSNPDFPFYYRAVANPVEFPSGKALFLTGQLTPVVQGDMTVVYATPFNVDSSWTESTDMIADVGMDERDLDMPAIGVMARLLRGMTTRRAMLNVQGQSREDQDVSMATILQAQQAYAQEIQSRRGDMKQRLLTDWPYRSSNY